LGYLSSVATIKNPLYYFIQDHGHGNNLYRPLTPVGIWLVYQMFGVWALPNQIINLILHLANVFLLYRIVQRERADRTIAFLVAAVFMISQYTFLAATWVSDRPMVLTGLFLLLLVNHLSQHDKPSDPSTARVRVAAVASFSVLALMSKESGLIVPGVGLLYALMPGRAAHLATQHRVRLACATASIIGLYIVWRLLIFGSGYASYSQDGYMFFGLVHYRDSDLLPQVLRYLNYAENVIKNAVAPALPVFTEAGALLTPQSLLVSLPVTVSTALLVGLTAKRNLSHLQRIALMIIVVNSVIHFGLFRFRLHYLSHAALCLFVGSSPLLGNSTSAGRTKLAAKTLAVVALAGGILSTSNRLNDYVVDRNRALKALATGGIERYGHVAEQVLQRYPSTIR
jgi:hypothetical protein